VIAAAQAESKMEQRRRFIFHADAAAFSGRIIRPKDIVLEAPGASSLTVAGGRSVARIPGAAFDGFFSIESATTLAEGLFDDPNQFREFTFHRVAESTLTASSRAFVEVNGLVVGRAPQLRVGRLRAELTGRGPLASGQPAIRVGRDTLIEKITVDGHPLIVELDPGPFQRLDTYAKLLTAADDPAFVKESGTALFMHTAQRGEEPPRTGWLFESSCGAIYATIVKSIRWDGTPFPGSQIEYNVVTIPELGRLHFGELLISAASRRLTMLRLVLGSEAGGSAACADVQNNGGWGYP
jgi:hypothetical protein